ncbi:hypothetical protein [Streptococcus oriscaviae]|uniref:Uncharacterized protein n=1 Tax=Streptococcus oriscaviae TaxID=2781599 RepID=A0ABX7YIP2_9STRE|nr:hypothetical protein [Streptococcus oriscaviae]QUE53666.1 hypothetical protein INT76_07440 [Streptococcus oriscaviae]
MKRKIGAWFQLLVLLLGVFLPSLTSYQTTVTATEVTSEQTTSTTTSTTETSQPTGQTEAAPTASEESTTAELSKEEPVATNSEEATAPVTEAGNSTEAAPVIEQKEEAAVAETTTQSSATQKGVTSFRSMPRSAGLTDLTNVLTDVVIDATQDAQGNYVVRPNGEYDIILNFAETESLQLNNGATLSYAIPVAFQVADVANTTFDIEIKDSNGTATLSNNVFRVVNNVVYVEFNQADATNFARLSAMANVKFTVQFKGKFSSNVNEVTFNSKIRKTFTFDQTSSLTLEKEAAHVKADGKVQYTLKVTSEGDNRNVVITDTLLGSALTPNQDVTVTSNKKGVLSVTPNYSGK